MIGNTLFTVGAVLATTISAQTAPGFPVSAPASLNVVFAGNNTVSPPGELIPRPDTANPPSVSSPVLPSTGNGVLLIVDLDVPRDGQRVQLLHWLATNVTRGSNNQLTIPNSPVPYLQPSPPVGDVPHAYTLVLFAQPANFSIPAQYANLTNNRVPFNTSKFLSDAGLGPALAANYIRVQNLTGSATQTFPPARPTQTGASNSSAPAVFPGAATQAVVVGGATLYAAIATALLTGFAAVML